jgi:hypothetical protein
LLVCQLWLRTVPSLWLSAFLSIQNTHISFLNTHKRSLGRPLYVFPSICFRVASWLCALVWGHRGMHALKRKTDVL